MLRPPRFLARQLALPSGLFGRLVMARFLNRLNSHHNDMVLKDLALESSSRVLEVGFGGAALLEALCRSVPEGFVSGLEVSEDMLARAQVHLSQWIKSGHLDVRLGSIASLPYTDECFDRGCSVHTTYFWPDLGKGLAEFHRVIRPGGRLVLGLLSADDIIRAGLDRHGFSLHSLEELESALIAARFSPGHSRSARDLRGTLYTVVAKRC
jgi:arsenite methyltransferase